MDLVQLESGKARRHAFEEIADVARGNGALVIDRPRGLAGDLASSESALRHALDVDSTGERLAFGSSTGSLWVSENSGDSWMHLSAHLPPIYAVRFA